ncbi:hypothetical protein CspHIS471_0510340 [Cutaneotrichosporon sp. HIS471]|nr:hypothetical protein CspHIS471_0510340 [Cutaneotrichosporon sp. HIS471]
MSQLVAYCFPRSGDSQHHPLERRVSRGGGESQSRAFTWRKLVSSYWSDWVFIGGLWVIYLSISRIPGHRREFSLRELSLQHSFAEHELVPPNMLMFVTVGLPLIVMLPIATFIARNAWDVHNAACGLFMSFTMAGVVTQVIKLMVGRPRPDLIARCQPSAGAHDAPVYGLSNWKMCTQQDFYILNDGFKSFPSGHSSLSFAGVGFLALYLAGKMHLWDVYGNRNRAWFALSPLLIGAMVAISRTQDNRHHWQDVLVGSILGMCIATIAYRTYYPHLAHSSCHLPMLPRVSDMEEEDVDLETGVRLLNDQQGIPRQSEEEEVWRRN